MSVQTKSPESVNILTALTENEGVVKSANDAERRAIALAWLFHLVGDVHQPLHTAQLFTVDYPNGDRGGNEICVRVTQAGQPMDLHRFWDGVITSSQNFTRLRNEAIALRTRPEFQRVDLTELANAGFDSWAKESYETATKIASLTVDGLGHREVAMRTARWSQRLLCFLRAMLSVRAGLLTEG